MIIPCASFPFFLRNFPGGDCVANWFKSSVQSVRREPTVECVYNTYSSSRATVRRWSTFRPTDRRTCAARRGVAVRSHAGSGRGRRADSSGSVCRRPARRSPADDPSPAAGTEDLPTTNTSVGHEPAGHEPAGHEPAIGGSQARQRWVTSPPPDTRLPDRSVSLQNQ